MAVGPNDVPLEPLAIALERAFPDRTVVEYVSVRGRVGVPDGARL